jgi:transposase-like protein
MNETKQRRHFTGQEKVAILRRHLVERIPVSQLCEEHRLQPTQFYNWQKTLFEQGSAVFDGALSGRGSGAGNGRLEAAAAKRIAALEEKLKTKNEVVAELLEDHVRLKKELGDL